MNSRRMPGSGWTWILIAADVLFIVVTTAWIYAHMPSGQYIPIHFNFSGQPNGYISRQLFPLLYLFTEGIVFAAFCGGLLRNHFQKRDIYANSRIKAYLKAFNSLFYSIVIFLLFNYSLYYSIYGQHSSGNLFLFVILLIIGIDVVVSIILIKRADVRPGSAKLSDLERSWRMEKNWKLGIFYCNPEDPRFFVPKRTGLGWTINNSHRYGAAFFYIILLVFIFLLAGK